MKALLQYDWPGNVRELENCMERAVALGDRRRIDMATCTEPHKWLAGDGFRLRTRLLHLSVSTDLEDIERATIQRVFEQVKGDKALAGRMLG